MAQAASSDEAEAEQDCARDEWKHDSQTAKASRARIAETPARPEMPARAHDLRAAFGTKVWSVHDLKNLGLHERSEDFLRATREGHQSARPCALSDKNILEVSRTRADFEVSRKRVDYMMKVMLQVKLFACVACAGVSCTYKTRRVIVLNTPEGF